MKKRLIDAEHLMQRLEANYGSDNSWYDLVRVKTLIDSEPTIHDDNRQLIEVALIFLTAVIITVLLFWSGVIH